MRRRWYLLSIIPLVLLIAAVGYFTYMQQWTAYAITKYQDKDLKNATYSLQHTELWMPAQRWIQPYDYGTVKVAQGAYKSGIADLEQAESLAPGIDTTTKYYEGGVKDLPPMCKIRINHAYAYGYMSEAAQAAGEVSWNALNAAVDSAKRASSKSEYSKLIAEADKQKAASVEQYTIMEESSARSAELLEEYLCTDPSEDGPGSAQQQRKNQESAQQKLDAAQNMEYPQYKEPEKDPSAEDPSESDTPETDTPEQEPDQNSDNESDQDTEQDSPDQTDSEDQEKDPESGENSQEQAPYTADEEARQELLQERNKAGKTQREEADAWENATSPSDKQW